MEQAFEEANESWKEWINGLGEQLAQKASNWSSEYNPIFQQKEIIQDYINQFRQDLEKEIDKFGNQEIQKKILKPKLATLETYIRQELKEIQNNFLELIKQKKTNNDKNFNFDFSGVEGSWGDFWQYLLGGIAVGGMGGGLFLFLETILNPIGLVIAVVTAVAAGAFGFGVGGIKDKIKLKVFEAGWEKFAEATEELSEQVGATIIAVFDNRVESAIKVIKQTISFYETLLEEQDKLHQQVLKECEFQKKLHIQKRQDLERVKENIETILNQLAA
jgi:hypothetical protein